MNQEQKIDFVDVSFNNNFIPDYHPFSINQISHMATQYNEAHFLAMSAWNCEDIPRYFNFLREHPWERLQKLKEIFSSIPLIVTVNTSSLSNGEPTSPELVKTFCKILKEYEVSTARLFDPFNDIENLKDTIDMCLSAGLGMEGSVFINPKDPHHVEKIFNVVSFFNNIPDSKTITLMEPTGILKTHQLKKILKNIEDIIEKPLKIAIYGHLERIYSLYDLILQFDFNIASIDVSCINNTDNKQFTVMPPNAKLLYGVLKEHNINPVPNLENILKIEHELRNGISITNNKIKDIGFDLPVLIYREYPENIIFDIFLSLKENNTLYLLPKALDELNQLISEFEYPPLIAPFSEMLASQALLNIMSIDKGKNRYEILTEESKKYLQGYYTKLHTSFSDKFKNLSKMLLSSSKKELWVDDLPIANRSSTTTTNELFFYHLYPKDATEYFEFKHINEKYAVDVFDPNFIAKIVLDILNIHDNSNIIIPQPSSVNQRSKLSNLWSLVGRLEQMGRHI